MKLASLVLASLVSTAGIAAADPPAPRHHLKQRLVQAFDRNGDGHLDKRERRQAARVLRRIARRLSRAGAGGGLQMRQQLMQRYDLDRDCNIGPREMPPAAADRLRRFDRDGNGWVDPNELP